MQRDLLTRGLTLAGLGTPALSWYDLACLVRYAQPGDAIFTSLNERHQQTADNDLLRSIDFAVRELIYIELKKAKAHPKKPEPLLWPWEKKEQRQKGAIRGDVMTWDEAAERLGWVKLIEEEERRRGR